jgi:outer membrane protein assembly factor BamB
MSVHPLKTSFVTGISFLALAGSAWADNWPQWRGPTNDGICHEKGMPTTWTATENVVWSLKMPGMGSSTPAVWGDKIFLTSEVGEDVDLMCVSTAGKELWRRKLGSSDHSKRFMGNEGNNASASPCTDGKYVIAFTGLGDLACYTVSGEKVWELNAQDKYGQFRIQWGMHTTPLLHKDRLYVTLQHSGGRKVICFDKSTGKEIWALDREDDAQAECEQAYTSPVIWHKGGKEYLVVHGNDYCTAHELETGKELWRVGDLNPKSSYNRTFRLVASPLATEDLIVIPTAKNGPVVAIRPDAKGSVLKGNPAEQWRLSKGTPDVPSPLYYDGLVYLCKEDGKLACLDAKTGKEHYLERTHASLHRASPVYADGKIYLTAKDGVVTVVKAGPKFEVLATNRLVDKPKPADAPAAPPAGGGGRGGRRGGRGGPSFGSDSINASPAFSNGRIYLRSYDTLYAIEEGKKLIN